MEDWNMNEPERKKRPDLHLICMAGEFLTAGQLFKRGYLASVTLGNAKAIDILAHNPSTGRNFNVQVKTSQGQQGGYFFKKEAVRREHVYVFVILNNPAEREEYSVVRGITILNDMNKFFGETTVKSTGIGYKPLREFKDNWQVFDEPAPPC
jgi:hypothetical protein